MDSSEMTGVRQTDLGDLLSILWRGKWIVAAISVVIVAAASIIAVNMPNVYRSEVTLKPVEENGSGLPGGGGLAALGSLAGINVGGGGSVSDTDATIAVLKSRRFLVAFARRHNMTVPLMAAVEWDEKSRSLRLDPAIYDPKTNQWQRPAKAPLGREPTDEEIYREFRSILEVKADPATQLITVSVTFFAPDRAHQWASQLVRELNDELKRRRIAQTDRALAYLEQRMGVNTIASMSTALEQLYLVQLRERVLAHAREEFALETIDPANVPLFPHAPNRRMIAVAAAAIGVIFGVLVVLLLAAFRSGRRSPRGDAV